jgi:hypothetical protein
MGIGVPGTWILRCAEDHEKGDDYYQEFVDTASAQMSRVSL